MPVYYFVELRVLRMKLRFSAEKEALDLRTGKMVQVGEDGFPVADDAVSDPARPAGQPDPTGGQAPPPSSAD
jgi:hypothetical protein